MTTLSLFARAALTAAVLASAGCLSRPYQGQTLYALDGGSRTQAQEAGAAASAPGASPVHAMPLRVAPPSVGSPYSTTQFVYRYADGSMRTDPYAGFIASPESLIGGAVRARLSRAGLFQHVVGGALLDVGGYELVISMRVLGASFDGAKGTATVAGVAYVVDDSKATAAVVAELPIEASAPVADDSADAVAAGVNAAFAQWMDSLCEALRSATLPTPAPAGNGSASTAPRAAAPEKAQGSL